MSYYRDKYLKSPEWENLRNQVLSESDYICEICRIKSHKMDVHHLRYGRLYDVTKKDLRSVCRSCHDNVHKLLKKHPKLKKLGAFLQWKIVMQHLGNNRRSLAQLRQSKVKIFSNMRDFLCGFRIAKRKRMVLHPSICSNDFIPVRKHPLIYLRQYIAATGIDPRHRVDRIGAHKLLTWPI